jgi:hypothetical protein
MKLESRQNISEGGNKMGEGSEIGAAMKVGIWKGGQRGWVMKCVEPVLGKRH